MSPSKPWTIQRLRVPLGFVAGALYLWAATRSPWLSWRSLAAGAVVGLAGLLVRAWAAGHIVKNDRLATTGPYAHTRNPLYFGSFLLAAGCALAVHWGLLLVVAAFWLGVYVPVIRREKAHVRSLYPEAYAEWEQHVPSFVPRLSPWRAGGAAAAEAPPFDLRLYLYHREWQAALGFAGVMAWLAYWTWRRQMGT